MNDYQNTSFFDSFLQFQLVNPNLLQRISIQFRNQGIGEQYAQQIGKKISQCIHLTNLQINLKNNHLKDEKAFRVFQGIENCENLSSLDLNLSNNNINAEGISLICQQISLCQNINTLKMDLSQSYLQNKDFSQLKLCLNQLKKLENLQLDLGNNYLGAQNIERIFSEISKCDQIKNLQLNLCNNLMESEGLQKLMNNISNLISLNSLQLLIQNNKIINDLSPFIQFSKMKNLIHLSINIQNSVVNDQDFISLGKGLSYCSNLKNLTLTLSPLEETISEIDENTFGSEIGKCVNLNQFILYSTQFLNLLEKELQKQLLQQIMNRNLQEKSLFLLLKGISKCPKLFNIEINIKDITSKSDKLANELSQLQSLCCLKIHQDLRDFFNRKRSNNSVIQRFKKYKRLVKFINLEGLTLV